MLIFFGKNFIIDDFLYNLVPIISVNFLLNNIFTSLVSIMEAK